MQSPMALLLLLGIAACGSSIPSGSDPPGTQDRIPPALRIEPAYQFISSEGPYQFHAVDHQGMPVPVYWRIDNPERGQLSAGGVLTPCYGGGAATIRALSQADTTKTAALALVIQQQAYAIVSVKSILEAPSGAVPRLDSVAGPVDVTVSIPAGKLTCKQVLGARLELAGAGVAVRIDSIGYAPIPTGNVDQVFRFNTLAVTNGSYRLRPVVVFPTYESSGNEIPIVIRNP
jgi:hypothetical protein